MNDRSRGIVGVSMVLLILGRPAFPSAPNIIPRPASLTPREGVFAIRSDTVVAAEGDAAIEARKLIESIAPAMGFRLKLVEDAGRDEGVIALRIEPGLEPRFGTEGYALDVTIRGVRIRAAGPAGLFYGVQTLRQLLPPSIYGAEVVSGAEWTVPCVEITDAPRFGWRGLLIDPARHFIPKDDVLRFIDAMAIHKLNRLQMHLTDDQGWRIEIRRYPRLTEIGAWREVEFLYGGEPDGKLHGGFYTQDDIREIVRYAAEHHVTIVPEIEMPGHARAAISAYPYLGVFPERQKGLRPWNRRGICEDILAPRPETIAFCKDVLDEVIALFPSRFIHIGGDEAVKTQWKASEEIQEMIREKGLKGEAELQAWFTRQIDAHLASRGRRLVGWDEILEGGLAPGAVVMSWRGEGGGIEAARAGHDCIMAPTSHTYFDYYQGPPESEPLAIGGRIPLQKVYAYEPIPAALTPAEAHHVLGAQAQLWGEFISDREHREYMTYPRACALAEAVWSPREGRDDDLFLVRLREHLMRLKAARIRHRPLAKDPVRWEGRADPNAPAAARALLARILPDHVDRFAFETIPPAGGRDVFEIEASGGKVIIRGNTAVSMAVGLNEYLKHDARCHVSWYGDQLRLPDPLPAVKRRGVSWARYRYLLNYCCFGYSLPFWDWAQWERLIDWMALNGVNMPLSVTGQEAVWRAVCRRIGMSEAEIASFLAGPPFLPFQWMGCLDGWGGPLPASWVDRHEDLGRRILARERELGMTPVLQGFTGHVPEALAEKHPDAKIHRIAWIEWKTCLLDPLDPRFAEVARMYMEEQARRFGTDHLYAADTFIEMQPPSDDPKYLSDLSRAIFDGMAASDPEAVWVLQGWLFFNNPGFWKPPQARALFGAVPDDRMVVLDLFCEAAPTWTKTDAFHGKPWLWCNIQSFGRTVQLNGALPAIAEAFPAIRRDPDAGRLSGLGFVNEGLCYNPIVYDLMFEMAWRDEKIDLPAWVDEYAGHRYGRLPDGARRAWRILLDTVYDGPHGSRSAIDHLPALRPMGGPPYDNANLADAWSALLSAADELGDVDTYRFDLVNVARQALSNHAAIVHGGLVDAVREKDAEAFARAAAAFLALMDDLDALLATRRE
ncbi:MAG: family 20 glycosylhydrolase, partial [Planctomycetes bacterium]|nr:family 20 glycosylhydrolase [Planctomycetota bacterium]